MNPATGKPLAHVAQATAADVDRAVRAARARAAGVVGARRPRAGAVSVRARAPGAEAQPPLRRARVARQRQADPRTRDIDMPARGPALLSPRRLGAAHGAASSPDRGRVGVVGQIIPWNFPLLMLAWKIAPALAMGNTVVLKPAEFTPLTALLSPRCARRSACRPAWSTSSPATAARARRSSPTPASTRSRSPAPPKSAGSSARRRRAAGKKLSLELGGKSPFIVFDDADLDSAVEGVVDAIWFNQGQVCCAGSRLLVQEGVASGWSASSRRAWRSCAWAIRSTRRWTWAPSSRRCSSRRSRAWCDRARTRAPDVAAVVELPQRGLVLPADALHRRVAAATIAQVEIFGPVLVLDDLPHAGRGGRARQQHPLRAGRQRLDARTSTWRWTSRRSSRRASVWINSTNLFDAACGFGGYRESGFGREGGREGLWEYVKRARGDEARGSAASGEVARLEAKSTHRRRARRPPAAPAADRPHAKCTSAASRRGPTAATACRCSTPPGGASARSGEGNRKDIRNAVEAAHKARRLGAGHGAQPAQVLYYSPRTSPRAPRSSRRAALARCRRRADARGRRSPSSGCSPTPPGPTSTTAGAPAAVPRRDAGDATSRSA